MSNQLQSLRDALNESPDNIPLLQLYAATCLEEYEFDEALCAYQHVLQLRSNNTEAKMGLARTLYLKGRLSEAIVRVEAITTKQPRHAAAWMLHAQLMLAEGQTDAAQASFERALLIDRKISNPALELEIYGPAGRPRNIGAIAADEDPADVDTEDVINGLSSLFGHAEFMESEDSEDPYGFDDEEDGIIVEQPSMTFADAGLSESIAEEIRLKVLYPIKNPNLFKAYGKSAAGAVVLYGPPGCGQKVIGQAAAGEADARFIAVNLPQMLDLWAEESDHRIHELFDCAREHAPTILFFEDLDVLSEDRPDLNRHAGRAVAKALLAELSSQIDSNEGIVVLGSTNSPWDLQPILRRPQGFDRVLFVPPPDENARAAIIAGLMKDKPIEKPDVRGLARKTREYSNLDLKAVFDLATERSLAAAMREGRIVPITMKDLYRAAKETKPSPRAWFDLAKNHALYADQGGFYNELLKFLGISK